MVDVLLNRHGTDSEYINQVQWWQEKETNYHGRYFWDFSVHFGQNFCRGKLHGVRPRADENNYSHHSRNRQDIHTPSQDIHTPTTMAIIYSAVSSVSAKHKNDSTLQHNAKTTVDSDIDPTTTHPPSHVRTGIKIVAPAATWDSALGQNISKH